jgi:hypothetical protein
MTSQPLWEQIKSARISRGGLIGLLAGILLGLVLGLLIGWVWWPVEWQNGAGAVTVAEAEYMSLVADAYQGAGGAPGAAELARARLAQMNLAATENFLAATEYFAAQPGRSDQVRNLVTLSIALGTPLDVAANPALAEAMLPPDAPALSGASSADSAQGDAAPEQGQGSGVNGFALVLLLALVLFAGGAYFYYVVTRQRNTAVVESWTSTAGGFNDEEGDDDAGFSGGASATSTPIAAFDPWARQAAPSRAAPTSNFSTRSYSTPNTSPPVMGPSGFDPDDDFDAGARTSTAYLARPTDEPESQDDDEREDEEGEEEALTDTMAPAASVAAAAGITTANASAPPPPAVPSRYERYKTIDSYAAAFHAGMANVDFMRNVEDAATGRYIGEYGMFVHDRHGLLNGNTDDVIAFEVTLVDKVDEHPALTTIARNLISEYAHDALYNQFTSDSQSRGQPITAQKGTNFQLEGDQLLLDCTVTEVSYTKDGVFRSLTLDMVLKRR